LPTQKRRSRNQKGELPGHWVERYKEKVAITVARTGYYSYPNEDCVFHFRVSGSRILPTEDTAAPKLWKGTNRLDSWGCFI